MNKFEQELEITKRIISSRQLTSEGAFNVQVERVTEYADAERNTTHIVNLKAMTNYHVSQAKKLLSEALSSPDAQDIEKYNTLLEAVRANNKAAELIQSARNQQLTTSVRANGYVPSQGEIIKINTATMTTKNDVTGIFVINYSEIKAKTAGKVEFDLDDIVVPTAMDISDIVAEAKPFGVKQ